MLGLQRLKLDAIWLELLPGSGDVLADQSKIRNFQRQLRTHGLARRYCLLYQNPAADTHDLGSLQCIGISKRELLERIGGPNVLLNLAYSIHPPLLLKFERRFFCDLDPSEIFYWMTKMEVGQSYHHEFWTIGLNVHGDDCGLPKSALAWKTFYPLADTKLYRLESPPRRTEIHYRWSVVLEWGGRGCWRISGSLQKICLQTLSKSSSVRAGGAF